MISETTSGRNWFQNNRLLWGLILVAILALLRFVETFTWRNWFRSSDFQETTSFALFLLLWFVLISVGLVAGGIVRLTRTSWRDLGWTRKSLAKSIGLGLLGFVLLYINAVLWAMLKGNAEQPQMFAPSLFRLFVVVFFAFGLVAWTEENLFRGYLQPLLSERMVLGLAILLQAAIFSVAHLGFSTHLLDFGSALVAGLILGWLRGRQSSLVAPYVAHGLFWTMGAFMVIPA